MNRRILPGAGHACSCASNLDLRLVAVAVLKQKLEAIGESTAGKKADLGVSSWSFCACPLHWMFAVARLEKAASGDGAGDKQTKSKSKAKPAIDESKAKASKSKAKKAKTASGSGKDEKAADCGEPLPVVVPLI